jgi:hypothetical protein
MKRILSILLVVLFALSSCEKNGNDDSNLPFDEKKGDITSYDSKGAITETNFPAFDELCDTVQYQLLGGQTIDEGDIVVGSTNDSVFLSIVTTGGFADDDENLKIWIGKTMIFEDRPSAGSFPYKYTLQKGVLKFYAGWSFEELGIKCGDKLFLVVHGDMVDGETAFGGKLINPGPGKAWWYYMEFTIECCEPTVRCTISGSAQVTHPTCFKTDGAIVLTVNDASTPITYLWSTGATTKDIAGLAPGTYSVEFIDAKGCTGGVKNIVLVTPDCPCTIGVKAVPTAVKCNGGADGSIELSVVGGTPPYTFEWVKAPNATPAGNTQNLTGLTAGTYMVTVKDAGSCNYTLDNIVVTEPEKLTLESVVRNIKCESPGLIDVTVTGGTSPYTYAWDNGATTEDLSLLTVAGEYRLVVTDANGCTAGLLASVTEEICVTPKTFLLGFKTYVDDPTDPMVDWVVSGDMASINESLGMKIYSYTTGTSIEIPLLHKHGNAVIGKLLVSTSQDGLNIIVTASLDDPTLGYTKSYLYLGTGTLYTPNAGNHTSWPYQNLVTSPTRTFTVPIAGIL